MHKTNPPRCSSFWSLSNSLRISLSFTVRAQLSFTLFTSSFSTIQSFNPSNTDIYLPSFLHPAKMISTPTRLAALLSLALPLASATFSFNTSFTYPNSSEPYIDFTIPGNAGISDACSTAYAKPVPCDEWLIKGLDQSGDGPSEDEKFEKSTLDALCTTQCLDGLLEWQDAIRADCTKADIDAAGKDGSAGSVVLTSVSQPDMPIVEMLYWPTCLKDL